MMNQRKSIISLLCRGAKLEDNEKLLALQLLEQNGYRARLVELTGDLEEWNGKRVKPVVLKRFEQYLVKLKKKLPDGKEEELQLVLPPQKLVVEVDRHAQVWEGIDFEKSNNATPEVSASGVASNKISSVRVAMNNLCSQIRATIKRATQENTVGIEELFASMDENGDNLVDKEELLEGFKSLKIQVSRAEINLIWPMFDKDQDGTIDIKEFIGFAKLGKYDSRKKDWAESKAKQHIVQEQMTAMQRKMQTRKKFY